MAWRDIDIGAVSAYAVAVEQGYQGTEEQWAMDQAQAGVNGALAKQSAETAIAAAEAAQKALESLEPNTQQAIADIQTEGRTQRDSVTSTGDAQNKRVLDTGAEQSSALDAQGATERQKVVAAGDEQVSRVTNVGDNAVESVTLEKTNAINGVQSTKNEAVSSVESAKMIAVEAIKSAESAAIQNIGTGVDDTLSISGKAADAKKTGDSISSLKDDIDATVTKTPISRNLANPAEYISNKVMTSTGALVDSESKSAFVMGKISVTAGETIWSTLPRSINFYDANENNIQSLYTIPSAEEGAWDGNITIPEGINYIVITGYNSYMPYMVNRGTELLPYEEYSDEVEYEVKPSVLPDIPVEKVPSIGVDKIIGLNVDSVLPFVYEPEYTMSKGYMTPNGTVTETENHKHTSKISVNAGDVISIVSPKKGNIRFVCAFDENDNAKYPPEIMEQIYSYTVPDGIASVVLTIENRFDGYYKLLIATFRNVSGAKYVSKTELPNNSIAVVKNKVAPKLHDKVSGVVNSETGMKINACCCQNKTIMFRGNISSIADIVIGLGHNGAREIFYKIDSAKVKLYTSASGNPVVDIEHGLAISGYICVTINANDNNAKITVATMSGVFTHETNGWLKNPAEVFVETDSGSVLTDCELIFCPNDIRKSIWLFGDSYMSYADNRVLFWLKNLGAKNFCINALPGEGSDRAMTDLLYMMEYSTPSTIIWNMGMNDDDKNNSVNQNWETCFNLLKAICGEKDIELILYTVPSVPKVDNEYKNAVIRDSGYKYIDGASAVGASASGVWNDGMLSDDGVHPNTTGAIAIAQEMILTVPELLLN